MTGRVVFVLKGYPRLSETFIAQEILGLERAGLDIEIVALRRPTDRQTHPVHAEVRAPVSYLPEYLRDDPARVLRGLWRCLGKSGLAAATFAFLRDLVRDRTANRGRRFGQALVLAGEMQPGVRALHAHFIHTPASVCRYASLITGLPWSCSAHAKDIWTSREWDLREKLAGARWAVTCTAAGAAELNRLAPGDNPVRLIYHGFDRDRFPPLAMPRQKRNGLDGVAPVRLLSVGRAVEKKGFDLLLDALAALPKELAWSLVHIGGGERLADLQAQAGRLGLSQRIDWRGPQAQDRVLSAYREADLFVLPCRVADDGDRDGLPNVIVEAQSQSLAVVSTAVSAIPELIEHDVTGLLIPPEDIQCLARAIERLIRDPALRIKLGKAGGRKVHALFGHEEGIARLMALFEASSLEVTDPVEALRPEPAE